MGYALHEFAEIAHKRANYCYYYKGTVRAPLTHYCRQYKRHGLCLVNSLRSRVQGVGSVLRELVTVVSTRGSYELRGDMRTLFLLQTLELSFYCNSSVL